MLTVLALLAVSATTAFQAPSSVPRRQSRLRAFDPGPVDSSVILGQLSVIAVSAGAASFWWYVTVPEKRLELSRSKKGGDIKELLDDLEDDSSRKLERWLLSDWLNPDRRKEPALPFLPKGKFNSGDNPIIAAGALIMAAGVANALGERAFDIMN